MCPFKEINIDQILDDNLKDNEFKMQYIKISHQYDLADQLIKIRKFKGLSQKQLAQKTELSQQAISRLEREKHIPKMDTLFKILEGLDASLEIIMRD